MIRDNVIDISAALAERRGKSSETTATAKIETFPEKESAPLSSRLELLRSVVGELEPEDGEAFRSALLFRGLRGILDDVVRRGLENSQPLHVVIDATRDDVAIPPKLLPLADRNEGSLILSIGSIPGTISVSDGGFVAEIPIDGKKEILDVPFGAVIGFFDVVEDFAIRLRDA
jgi:hypothetical protein